MSQSSLTIREFIVRALNDEMGLQAVDPELAAAKAGGRYATPSGMIKRHDLGAAFHERNYDGSIRRGLQALFNDPDGPE